MDRLPLPVQLLLLELVRIAAPFVCIVYREGWFNTPDNPASPHGQYEPKMQGILRRWGPRINDWWWLGVRNRAYGLAYAMKPRRFKTLTSYEEIARAGRDTVGRVTTTRIDELTERIYSFGWCHLIVGHRVSPIFNEIRENNRRRREGEPLIPYRSINMDARPIISIRSGKAD